MNPIFVPTAADIVTAALFILGGGLFVLGCWLWAEWMFKIFDVKDAADEAPTQPPPADPAQSDWLRAMDDGVVHRRPDRFR